MLKLDKILCTKITDTVTKNGVVSEVATQAVDTVVSDLTEDTPEPVEPEPIDVIGDLGINVSEGLSREFVLDLLQSLRKNAGVKAAYKERLEQASVTDQSFKSFMKDVRLTAGGIFKFNQCVLDKPVLELRREREQERLDKQFESLEASCDTYQKQKRAYEKVQNLEIASAKQWSNAHLKASLQVRKKKADGPMPTKKQQLFDLFERCKDKSPLSLREHLLDQGKNVGLVDKYFQHITARTLVQPTINSTDSDENIESLPAASIVPI